MTTTKMKGMADSPDTSNHHFTESTLGQTTLDSVNVPRRFEVPSGQTTTDTSRVALSQTSPHRFANLRRASAACLLIAPLVATAPIARALVDRAAPELARVATVHLDHAFTWRPVSSPRPTPATPAEPPRTLDSKVDTPARRTPAAPRAASANKTHRGILVRADAVIRAVRSGQRPSSVPAPATTHRPAGLSLVGVSACGTGLRDGDVLTNVGGSPATSEGAVVGNVAGALSRGAKVITAEVWRGDERFAVAVEIPGPEEFSSRDVARQRSMNPP